MKNNYMLKSTILKKEIMRKLFFIILSIMIIITSLLYPVISFAINVKGDVKVKGDVGSMKTFRFFLK